MQSFERKPAWAIDLSVFLLLVAIGAVGRFGQPTWNFTPIAAVGLFAGAYFNSRAVALSVPLFAMLVSNVWLPAHNSAGVMAVVYLALMAPALAGPLLRFSPTGIGRRWVARLGLASVLPSTSFFLITNLAVWLFRSDYSADFTGLLSCYANALPFWRQMLAGDLLYVPMIFGAAFAAGACLPQRASGLAAVRIADK